MSIEAMAGKELEIERGQAVVCVPLGVVDRGAPDREALVSTLQSVAEHTDVSVPLLIAGPVTRIEQALEESSADFRDRVVHTLELTADASETQAVNAMIGVSFPGDLALVVAGVSVSTDWLPGLQAAAVSDSIVASATPLSLGVAGVELLGDPEMLSPAQIEHSFDGAFVECADTTPLLPELAEKVAKRSQRLWPRVATIGPGCAYICRHVLELLGPLDECLSLDEALLELAVRALREGMVHVAADDVLVAGNRGDSPVSTGSPASTTEEAGRMSEVVEKVRETVADDEHGSLRRAVNVACAALRAPSVTIDGRSLTSVVGGTQTYILELIMALARNNEVSLRVLIPHDLSERARTAFEGLSEVELVGYEQALEGVPLSDVVHRPQQAFTPSDVVLLRLLGRRIVIGQQDLIAYHNHSYHPDVDRWRAYRRTTRLALAAADRTIFFSEHARRDGLVEDLLPVTRTEVVSVGADTPERSEPDEVQPDGVWPERPFLLCIGADYAHKNRPFAIELIGALSDIGWTGGLVFAGSHVAYGSSRERERDLLERRPDLAERVIDLDAVDEAGKRWLYKHARALVYPTLYEGFGLVPLEAARAGLPCLFAPQASLIELAGQAATLVPWDPLVSAAAVLPLLADGPERERHLQRLRALALPSWADTARQLVEVYERAIAEPPSEAADRAWQELDREEFIVRLDRDIQELKATAQEYQDAYHTLSARVAEGLPLIDEGGLLSPSEQRGLMRIASRRLLRGPILAPIGLLGHRSSRSQEPPRSGDRQDQAGSPSSTRSGSLDSQTTEQRSDST